MAAIGCHFFWGFYMRHDIGHVYIDSDVGRFEFYPTFKNIRRMCEPEDVCNVFAGINGLIQNKIQTSNAAGLKELSNSYKRELYQLCSLIMKTCCKDDLNPLIGRIKWEKSYKHFQLGVMPLDHMVAFSKVLLKHGIIGVNTGKKGSNKKCDKLDVYDFVHIAMAHLDMSMEQAESLTKTEFDKLMTIKFPDHSPSNSAPSDEDYEEAMAFLDRRDASKKEVSK